MVVISEYKGGKIDVNEFHIKERKVTFETKWATARSFDSTEYVTDFD